MSLVDNLRDVNEAIANAARASGRTANDVRLIAVSKTKPLSLIEEAFRAGQKSFGENYVQEAVEKAKALPAADWHFIGSLQTNKVKQVVGEFSLIHSVDRLKLAREISKAGEKAEVVQDILLQIHVGEEETKGGVDLEGAPKLIEEILGMKNLRLRGIMSLPPLTDDEKISRGYFSLLRESFTKWQSQFRGPEFSLFNELSMGTSSDFEWAILEGATMVRVGTMIFGAREPKA
jgi:pyridoxal phosphate enzyme (YggS family)